MIPYPRPLIEYLPLGYNKRDNDDSLELSESTPMKQVALAFDEKQMSLTNKNILDHLILLFVSFKMFGLLLRHISAINMLINPIERLNGSRSRWKDSNSRLLNRMWVQVCRFCFLLFVLFLFWFFCMFWFLFLFLTFSEARTGVAVREYQKRNREIKKGLQ